MTNDDPVLVAAYDQARADGNDILDRTLSSIREHTAHQSPVMAAVTVSQVLSSLPELMLRDLLQAAIHRLMEAEDGE